MTQIDIANPEAHGFCSERLKRIPEFFNAYLEGGKLPCVASLISRGDDIVHLSLQGATELGGDEAIAWDTIYRIYSMTKPITSVAAMMLHDEGKLRLDHELSRYIPEFKNTKVYDSGPPTAPITRHPDREIMIHDLFTHTSGISYGFLYQNNVDAMYRAGRVGEIWGKQSLEEFAKTIASLPLAFSPGEKFLYSHATDILGRVVEVASGMSLGEFFKTRIFDPLGMKDTGFNVTEENRDRLMACYAYQPGQAPILQDKKGAESIYNKPVSLESGGGGLVSTLPDYFQFCRMLANGGELNGHRLLSPKTLEFMTENHLPGGKTIADMGDKTFSEARMDGNGFGLGFSVTTDPVATLQPGSYGTYSWGGMASTFFWVDPVEDMICIQMTQLMPSGAYPIRPQFQQLAYAALI